VTSADAFRISMLLSREGLICGPSSGEALQGLLQYLAEMKRLGKLGDLADESTKEISCVFTCCDLPYQYLPSYFEKLDADEFPSIENQVSGTHSSKSLNVDWRSLTDLLTRYYYNVTSPNMTCDGFCIAIRQWSFWIWPNRLGWNKLVRTIRH
jgi:hypothetical protein